MNGRNKQECIFKSRQLGLLLGPSVGGGDYVDGGEGVQVRCEGGVTGSQLLPQVAKLCLKGNHLVTVFSKSSVKICVKGQKIKNPSSIFNVKITCS